MTTVSSVSPSSTYGCNAPATSAGGSASQKSNAGVAQSAASLSSSVENTFASLGDSSSLPLTYNAAGLLDSFQQATSAKSTTATTSAQAAQNAILAAENVVTETLNSLTSSSSPDSSTFDTSALFGLPGTSGVNNQFGLTKSSLLSTSTASSSGTQAAQDAVLAAENVVTETLNSLVSSSSSGSPASGM